MLFIMDVQYEKLPKELWEKIERLLPKEKPKPKGGRPPIPYEVVLAGIYYRLRTGCQWKALPEKFGSPSTCHRKFQILVQADLFEKIHRIMLKEYYKKRKKKPSR